MNQITPLTASEAREDLYNLIKTASEGLRSYEIKLRGADPVMLISKNELESWLETLDLISSPKEVRVIKAARKEKKLISHSDVLKKLGF